MRVFDDLEDTEAKPAREWTAHHLPEDRAAVLVHGDLLGQNILVFPDRRPAVIDWEFSRMGDPAFDLAIVTRGVRRPFQMARGLDRLLDAYAAAGGDPIQRTEVQFYEIFPQRCRSEGTTDNARAVFHRSRVIAERLPLDLARREFQPPSC